MMRVVVRKAEENVGRLCTITGWNTFGTQGSEQHSNSHPLLETPMCLLYTIAGHLPHVTHDAAAIAGIIPENAVYELTLPTLLDCLPLLKNAPEEERKGGISKFVGLPKSTLAFLAYNDPAIPVQSGYNDKISVSVFNRAGRRKIDLPFFENIQKTFQADCFQSLADGDTPEASTGKRLRKSVERTAKFASNAVDVANEVKRNVFISLAGGYSETDRMACIQEVLDLPCSGYVFDGFHAFGPLNNFQVSAVSKPLNRSIHALPNDRLRMFPGALNPSQVMDLVRQGIDMFDSSYTHLITEDYLALLVSNDLSAEKDDIFKTIDLKEGSHAKDLTPISTDCACYTCKNYTKAYLNHLWITKELLGRILLNVHNLHQYLLMFSNIRKKLNVELDQK